MKTANLELVSDLVTLDCVTCFRQSPRRIRARIQRAGGNAGRVLNPARIAAWFSCARRSPIGSAVAALKNLNTPKHHNGR